jgi:hypothetical protein
MKKLLLVLCLSMFGCATMENYDITQVSGYANKLNVYDFTAVGSNTDYLREQAYKHAANVCKALGGSWAVIASSEHLLNDGHASFWMRFNCQ